MKKILALCLVVVLLVTAVTGVTLAYFTDTEEVKNTFTMGKVDIKLDEAKADDDGKGDIEEKHKNRVTENDYTETNMVPGHVFDKDPTIHVMKGSEDSYIFLDLTINKYSSLFWVMAADAAEDGNINLPLYDKDDKLAEAFQTKKTDGSYVFSTTKFIENMLTNKDTFQKIITKWFDGIEHRDWEICDIFMGVDKEDVSKKGNYLTIRFAYQGDHAEENIVSVKELPAGKDCLDIKFMNSFRMPTTVTQKMISDGVDVGNMQNAFNTTIVYDEKGNKVSGEEFHMNFKAYAIQADELATLNDAYKAMFGMEKDAIILNKY